MAHLSGRSSKASLDFGHFGAQPFEALHELGGEFRAQGRNGSSVNVGKPLISPIVSSPEIGQPYPSSVGRVRTIEVIQHDAIDGRIRRLALKDWWPCNARCKRLSRWSKSEVLDRVVVVPVRETDRDIAANEVPEIRRKTVFFRRKFR